MKEYDINSEKEAKVLEISNDELPLSVSKKNSSFFGFLKRNYNEYKDAREYQRVEKASEAIQNNFSQDGIFNAVKATVRNTPFNDGLYYEFKTADQIKRSL